MIGEIVKPAMGMLGMQTDVPQPGIAQLDDATQGLISRMTGRAGRDAGDFTADLNKGALEATGVIGDGNQDKRLGGDAHMGDAIRGVYASRSGNTVNRILKANQYKGELAKADQMRRTMQTQMAQARVAAQNNAALVDAYNHAEMARANFVSQLFQLGGTGMAIAAANRKPASQSSFSAGESAGSGFGGSIMDQSAPSGGNYARFHNGRMGSRQDQFSDYGAL